MLLSFVISCFRPLPSFCYSSLFPFLILLYFRMSVWLSLCSVSVVSGLSLFSCVRWSFLPSLRVSFPFFCQVCISLSLSQCCFLFYLDSPLSCVHSVHFSPCCLISQFLFRCSLGVSSLLCNLLCLFYSSICLSSFPSFLLMLFFHSSWVFPSFHISGFICAWVFSIFEFEY